MKIPVKTELQILLFEKTQATNEFDIETLLRLYINHQNSVIIFIKSHCRESVIYDFPDDAKFFITEDKQVSSSQLEVPLWSNPKLQLLTEG